MFKRWVWVIMATVLSTSPWARMPALEANETAWLDAALPVLAPPISAAKPAVP